MVFVDARDRLRQYLEQRKEMGEQDLVLDGLSVEDLMKIVGAPGGSARAAGAGREQPAGPGRELAYGAKLGGSGDVVAAPVARTKRPEPPPIERPVAATAPSQKPVVESGPIVVGGAIAEGASAASHLQTLSAVAEAIAACQACALWSTATKSVPGHGNPEAKFVCVGEAPGATEDTTGLPFVGRAGDMLTKILGAVEFKRDDVFICNVLKHRPPGNRNPQPDEIAACSPFLMQQLALLKPHVILALGTFAAQTLLQTKEPIGRLRGQIHRFHGVPLVVTYHPAALLRNPNWKRPTWEDVQLARRVFDNASGA